MNEIFINNIYLSKKEEEINLKSVEEEVKLDKENELEQ